MLRCAAYEEASPAPRYLVGAGACLDAHHLRIPAPAAQDLHRRRPPCGIVEAAVSLLAIEHGLLPGTLNSQTLDPVCGPQIRRDNEERATRTALSFSFGFGGSNCVLAFGQV